MTCTYIPGRYYLIILFCRLVNSPRKKEKEYTQKTSIDLYLLLSFGVILSLSISPPLLFLTKKKKKSKQRKTELPTKHSVFFFYQRLANNKVNG